MTNKVEVKLDELKRVFNIVEEVHDLLHQPEKYKDTDVMDSFVQEHYAELHAVYYDILWNWLPQDVQTEILDR